jgi:hypothetical protein
MSSPVVRATMPTEEAYASAAAALHCDVPAIKAVATIEAGPQGAFIAGGFAPTILFERHRFHDLTGGVYDDTRVPGMSDVYNRISDPERGGYGPYSVQHPKLVYAVALGERSAALKSCSWGLFQIMGSNYSQAGYPNLQQFINAMYRSVDDHLDAFVGYILNDTHLRLSLRNHDWPTFARLYNGAGYRKSHYDDRIAAAYLVIERGDTYHG